jgi:NADH-quinone oxidoreductase subunit L
VGAWGAAIFHFMTHAFFKALLFLAAGIVIEALHHEHNIFRMGGLRTELPVAFWTFLIGGSALAGLPLITAGFYSKDLILWSAANSTAGGMGLWTAGIIGVVLTSLYTFRLIFVVFFGPLQTPVTHRPGLAMVIPACVLAFLAIAGGFDRAPFVAFQARATPGFHEVSGGISEATSSTAAGLAFLAGCLAAWYAYLRNPAVSRSFAANRAGLLLHRFWFADWGMDWLYDYLFVRPVVWLAAVNKADVIDSIYDGLACLAALCYRVLSLTETGKLRWYAAWIAGGSALVIALVILL